MAFPIAEKTSRMLAWRFRKKIFPTHAKYHHLVSELNALIENYETGIERRLSTGAEETDEENELNQDMEEAAE